MSDSDILKAALEKWGADAQMVMIFEEMSELQKELCKHARGADNVDHIAEEIADVQIMLKQMIILYDCERAVDDYMDIKIDRLSARLGIDRYTECGLLDGGDDVPF